jgi:hypothetical protein
VELAQQASNDGRVPFGKVSSYSIQEPSYPRVGRLWRFVVDTQQSFAEPATLGYVRDVDHVAGFQPHAIRELPPYSLVPPKKSSGDFKNGNRAAAWQISRLELVSLLMHEKPAVYVSKFLPRMQDLAQHPVLRPLDPFETKALDSLAGGKQIVYRASPQRIEMVGAIRAIKQCLQCHDTRQGALLGAFSYTIERDQPTSELPSNVLLAK